MLDGLKRWWSSVIAARQTPAGKAPASASPWAAVLGASAWQGVQPWAENRGYSFRVVRRNEGFVVDGKSDDTRWRMEWGPPQRPYVSGRELRLRCELDGVADLQAVIMNRALQEQMEASVFDQYVEDVQTRIDDQTPPEMRWLVMFPKLTAPEWGSLRDRYVAVSNRKSWLIQWLRGPLSLALASHRVNAATPLVLMVNRKRMSLRTELPEAEVVELERWLRLFVSAIRQAHRVGLPDEASLASLPAELAEHKT